MNSQPSDDLVSRIHRLLDGEMDAQELVLLETELLSNPDARKLYLQYANLHSSLESHFTSESEIHHGRILPIDRYLARQKRRIAWFSGIAAAAILMITALFLWLRMAESPTAIASFQHTPGSEFVVTHAELSKAGNDQIIRPGSRVEVFSGTIEVKFTDGVSCLIDAPCEVVFHNDRHVSMEYGVGMFQVPQGVSGFAVSTRSLKIVDLGTAFGIVAKKDGFDEVHVTQGSVEVGVVSAGKSSLKEIVKAGSARRFDESGKIIPTTYDSSRFPKQLIKPLKIRNSGFEETGLTGEQMNKVGYGPVHGWAASGAGVGYNKFSQPFLTQPAHEGDYVAFIQGKGLISQTIGGFDPAKLYTVTYFVNERGLTGASTRTSVTLDFDTTSYSPSEPIVRTDSFRRIVSGPLAVYGPSANVQISAKTLTGDASLLIDSVGISRAVPAIQDGGFETPVIPPKGFIQASRDNAGQLKKSFWNFANGAGVQHNGSPFSAPRAPEGSQTAVFQNAKASMDTMLHGFEDGVSYRLHLKAAARDSGAATLKFTLNNQPLHFHDSETLTPDSREFQAYSSDVFENKGGSMNFRIEAISDGSTFIDDLYFEFVAEAE